MTYNEERYVTWDEVQSHCRALAEEILARDKKFTKMLVITRGGMFPAGILARELEIRQIENVCIDTYDAQNIKTPTLLKRPLDDFCRDVLVIDDLADTGSTLKMVKDMVRDSLIVTIFAKPAGESLVDLFHEQVGQNVWVRFPWDTENGKTFVKPLALRSGPPPAKPA